MSSDIENGSGHPRLKWYMLRKIEIQGKYKVNFTENRKEAHYDNSFVLIGPKCFPGQPKKNHTVGGKAL